MKSKVVSLLSAIALLVAANAVTVDAFSSPKVLSASIESKMLAGQQQDRRGTCDADATCTACQTYTQCSPASAMVWVAGAGPFGWGAWVRINYCLGTGGNSGCQLLGSVKICRRWCTLTETCGNSRTDCGAFQSRRCSDYVENPLPGFGHCSDLGCAYRGGNCANCSL